MKHKFLAVSQEAIDFQSDKLYQAIIEEVKNTRAAISKYKSYDVTSDLEGLGKIIRDFTNISFVFKEGDPAMMPPLINRNHVFYDKELFSALELYGHLKGDQDITTIFRKQREKMELRGKVDLKNSRVEGVFAEIVLDMYMPEYFFKSTYFTPEECAAVILHELGHAFTYFEFTARVTSTNFALQALDSFYKQDDPKSKEIVLTAMRVNGYINERQKDQILKTKNKRDASIVFFDSQIENTVSELGASVYDTVGCEFLADQFSTRHGGGLALVTALNKMGIESRVGFLFFLIPFLILVGIAAFAGVLIYSLWIGLLIGGQDKANLSYDNAFSRYSRVKMQLIEQLKSKKMSPAETKKIIESIDAIGEYIKTTNPELDMLERLAYIFKPSYRAAHDQEKLQKFLESMAYNPLFVEHKKLSMI